MTERLLGDPMPPFTRDFAVAVFVVTGGRVLLHWHATLDRWLPPGGHIEPNELPDEAALAADPTQQSAAGTDDGGA